MRKLTFLILFLISIECLSQKFNGGFIAGVSTSQVSGDNLGGYNKAGLNIGVFTQYPLSSISNIKMEMTFIQKGSNNPKMNKNNIPDISTSYIEIPISVNYFQYDQLSLETGLSTGFLVNSSENDINGLINNENTRPFHKIDFGAFIGLNYFFINYLNNRIFLNTRLGNSIIPIRSHASNATYLFNKGQYNTVLSFSINYLL